ncbi:MAG TPA: aspartate/glutamate racemase family protein, partial [Solirubrobacterales bacterium]|nr:aspartate/glutamate racemase family protein [Solirubrobacterales bacterium]
MEGWIYPRVLTGRGIEHRVPGEEDRAVIDGIIFDELVNGLFSAFSRREYVRVIERLQRDGCHAVALVCTEIPLLVGWRRRPDRGS